MEGRHSTVHEPLTLVLGTGDTSPWWRGEEGSRRPTTPSLHPHGPSEWGSPAWDSAPVSVTRSEPTLRRKLPSVSPVVQTDSRDGVVSIYPESRGIDTGMFRDPVWSVVTGVRTEQIGRSSLKF